MFKFLIENVDYCWFNLQGTRCQSRYLGYVETFSVVTEAVFITPYSISHIGQIISHVHGGKQPADRVADERTQADGVRVNTFQVEWLNVNVKYTLQFPTPEMHIFIIQMPRREVILN